MSHKKIHLDTKICLVCNRPFTWRKKWKRDWDKVQYCSERCRRNKQSIIRKEFKTENKDA